MSMLEKFIRWSKESISLKIFVIAFFILILMIPLTLVNGLVSDRGYNKSSVEKEIYNIWGNAQVLQGPVLTVPYYIYVKDSSKKEDKYIKQIKYAYFLPDTLNIDSNITPEIRYRSIYKAVVYKSMVKVSAIFSKIDFSAWNIKKKDILYNQAQISFGLSDLRGLNDRVKVSIAGEENYFTPGVGNSFLKKGMSFNWSSKNNINSIPVKFSLNLNGSSSMHFMPFGKVTKVSMQSTWSEPSFIGSFLPDSREISSDGFFARWKIIDLNRNYPQRFRDSEIPTTFTKREYNNQTDTSFGAKLIIPVDYYQKSKRSTKYGFLIIVLTFALFFFVEIFTKKRIHALQYILVGIGLILFFTLLVSFSEHIGFMWAYIIASVATIGLIVSYAFGVFKSKKYSSILLLIMSLYYAIVYVLIHLQDYALLLGSIMLFIVLAGVMYVSRNIDWYNINKLELE